MILLPHRFELPPNRAKVERRWKQGKLKKMVETVSVQESLDWELKMLGRAQIVV